MLNKCTEVKSTLPMVTNPEMRLLGMVGADVISLRLFQFTQLMFHLLKQSIRQILKVLSIYIFFMLKFEC
jgi:hypothetical protein